MFYDHLSHTESGAVRVGTERSVASTEHFDWVVGGELEHPLLNAPLPATILAMDNVPAQNVVEFIPREQWEERLKQIADTNENSMIQLPKKAGRLNREEVAGAFLAAFEAIGGVPRLAVWANSNPTEFYKIMARLLPKEVFQQNDTNITITHVIPPSELDN